VPSGIMDYSLALLQIAQDRLRGWMILYLHLR
jgi:hypothetical protein